MNPAAHAHLPLVDALRAVAATVICGHHFASYSPLAEQALPLLGLGLVALRDHGRATQVFFVLGGYLLARQVDARECSLTDMARVVARRATRLLLPAIVATSLAVAVCDVGRDVLPRETVGLRPTVGQILAHAGFLQDVLGYESLSAGLWYLPIAMQLTLLFVGLVLGADVVVRCMWPGADATERGRRRRRVVVAGGAIFAVWSLALLGDQAWSIWSIYFFAYFFAGVLVQVAEDEPAYRPMLIVYLAILVGVAGFHIATEATTAEPLPLVSLRLLIAVATATLLAAATRLPWLAASGSHSLVQRLGRTAYSLYLLHFPVLVAVAVVWTWLGWTGPWAAVTGLVVAYGTSLAAAEVFYAWVEAPAARLSQLV
jgi:peptidoglycan/LPS O-acetylase OafA/YrhL